MMPTMQVILYDGTNFVIGDKYQVERIPKIGENIIATLAGSDQLSKVVSAACRCKDEFYIVVAKVIADVTNEDPGQIAEKLLGQQ